MINDILLNETELNGTASSELVMPIVNISAVSSLYGGSTLGRCSTANVGASSGSSGVVANRLSKAGTVVSMSTTPTAPLTVHRAIGASVSAASTVIATLAKRVAVVAGVTATTVVSIAPMVVRRAVAAGVLAVTGVGVAVVNKAASVVGAVSGQSATPTALVHILAAITANVWATSNVVAASVLGRVVRANIMAKAVVGVVYPVIVDIRSRIIGAEWVRSIPLVWRLVRREISWGVPRKDTPIRAAGGWIPYVTAPYVGAALVEFPPDGPEVNEHAFNGVTLGDL